MAPNFSIPAGARLNAKFFSILFLVIIVISATLIGFSLKKLKSTEYGLEYDIWRKQLADAADNGGLHLGPVGFEFVKLPSTFISEDLKGECVSQEGLPVQFNIVFQYQIPPNTIREAVLKYRDYEKWRRVVIAAARRSVQHSCSDFIISSFQNKRSLIQQTMFDNLKSTLEGSGMNGNQSIYVLAISLQLVAVEIPIAYKAAVAEKQSAEEDIELAVNQRKQETTKAQTEFLAAKEGARKMIDTANNEANITLTQATLKAEEIQLSLETETEVIVGIKEMLNLSSEGVLSYLSSQVYENAAGIRVSSAEPARNSWKEEL